MHKKSQYVAPVRRVMARVLAEDLQKVFGASTVVEIPGPKEPTISEAATSESLPDTRPPLI